MTLPNVNTIADGTAVKTPGKNVFPYLQKNLDDIITIEDDDLIVAFLDMVENHKMIVENSGLLTVAALKHLDVKDKKVVSILSGGNMDVITMSSVVQYRSDPERPYLYRICSASGQSRRAGSCGNRYCK